MADDMKERRNVGEKKCKYKEGHYMRKKDRKKGRKRDKVGEKKSMINYEKTKSAYLAKFCSLACLLPLDFDTNRPYTMRTIIGTKSLR